MAMIPLMILKKGLIKLFQSTKTRNDEIQAKLFWSKTISSADKQSLGNDGNLVDEHHILDMLESASDYERGIECLDVTKKATVKRLREWAGDRAAHHYLT
jgi:hypothetical protein